MITNTIALHGKDYRAMLDGSTGKLVSFCSNGVEMLHKDVEKQPLFEMRLYDAKGKRFLMLTEADTVITIWKHESGIIVCADGIGRIKGLSLRIQIQAGEALEYRSEISNGTDFFVENLSCPCVHVSPELEENDGDGSIFWARAEGVLITDSTRCPRQTLFRPEEPEETWATRFLYPGIVTMQYHALMKNNGSLYYAAHDTKGMPKSLAPLRMESSIRLDLRLYPCIPPQSDWKQDFPIVMKPFQGGWETAAEIYRTFVENGDFPLPPKLAQNPNLPRWVKQSPVVVIYPPRSVRGTGYYGRNEYFPYENGIKYLEELKEEIDSPIMAFLPYWEGSAPWAPPFCWPPFGGEAAFAPFVQKMHENGDLVGLYASGLHWTDQSLIDPIYDQQAYREKHNLTEVMCRNPDGTLRGGPCPGIRKEYAMCCACEPTRTIAYEQLGAMAGAGVDYVQYFDQHMGGAGIDCYSAEHGHPACFGPWNTAQMKQIFADMDEQLLQAVGKGRCGVGTEGAAADFYSKEMPCSELRGHMNFAFGIPVPAASYVLHRYTSNFMDNMSVVHFYIDRQENPDSILYTLAYSFIAGDALTLVLKSGGEIHYDWGQSWLEPGPKQRPVKKLVRNLNEMRRGKLRDFLIGGRMLPQRPFQQEGDFQMRRLDGSVIRTPEVLSSCWQNDNGERVQIFANFRQRDIKVVPDTGFASVIDQYGEYEKTANSLLVPALSAVAIRF